MAKTRLQVLLAKAGVASRRAAEKYIKDGRVAVNGEVVTAMGSRADPAQDVITVDGERLAAPQPPVTIMLHKPDMVVTTASDPEGRETVIDFVTSEPFRFVPVGRLDFHTEGLLLLTTDGELMNRLLHPRYHVPKVYAVKVAGHPNRAALGHLRDGVQLDDGPTRPAVVDVIDQDTKSTWLQVVVTEGRNRLIRRMCETVGHSALRVVRTEMATLDLHGLKPGQYRYLNGAELGALYRAAQMGHTPSAPPHAEQTGFLALGTSRRGRGRLPGLVDASVRKPADGAVADAARPSRDGERKESPPRPRSGDKSHSFKRGSFRDGKRDDARSRSGRGPGSDGRRRDEFEEGDRRSRGRPSRRDNNEFGEGDRWSRGRPSRRDNNEFGEGDRRSRGHPSRRNKNEFGEGDRRSRDRDSGRDGASPRGRGGRTGAGSTGRGRGRQKPRSGGRGRGRSQGRARSGGSRSSGRGYGQSRANRDTRGRPGRTRKPRS